MNPVNLITKKPNINFRIYSLIKILVILIELAFTETGAAKEGIAAPASTTSLYVMSFVNCFTKESSAP